MNKAQKEKSANEVRVPTTSLEVRDELVRALKLDLVGPGPGHAFAEEWLPGWVRPSNWYLTGFLMPSGSPPEAKVKPPVSAARSVARVKAQGCVPSPMIGATNTSWALATLIAFRRLDRSGPGSSQGSPSSQASSLTGMITRKAPGTQACRSLTMAAAAVQSSFMFSAGQQAGGTPGTAPP